jgi:nucleotide-binding universal stress UspA family protein
MREISQILVPIDFDKHTNKVVEFAIYFAGKLSANVNFLHVSETFGAYGGLAHPSLDLAAEELYAYYDQKMVNLVTDNKAKCAGCSGKVVKGDVVDEIIAEAKEENADLIIIGTHGSKGIEKIILGSVAERVVKNAPCPTLTINPYHE